jgi:hypothetical protein
MKIKIDNSSLQQHIYNSFQPFWKQFLANQGRDQLAKIIFANSRQPLYLQYPTVTEAVESPPGHQIIIFTELQHNREGRGQKKPGKILETVKDEKNRFTRDEISSVFLESKLRNFY